MGYNPPHMMPPEVQRRTAEAIGNGRDVIVTAETGSGKTLAFLMPTLARLTYPAGVDEQMEARPRSYIIINPLARS